MIFDIETNSIDALYIYLDPLKHHHCFINTERGNTELYLLILLSAVCGWYTNCNLLLKHFSQSYLGQNLFCKISFNRKGHWLYKSHFIFQNNLMLN